MTAPEFQLDLFEGLGHLSYMFIAASFLLRDILLLRMVAVVVAAACNLTFGYFAPEQPNLIVVFWQAVFILINTTWSVILIRERRGVRFSEEERELYQTIFRAFSPLEFMKVMRIARWEYAPVGTELAHTGDTLGSLMLIYNGEAEVARPDGGTVRIKDGAFVGEMSFIRGGTATATVATTQPTRYIAWPKPELRALINRNLSMRAALQTVFSEDLAEKLLQS